jgi:hypothetical protein
MPKCFENEEYTLNEMGLILGTSVNVSVIPTTSYTVFVDLKDSGGMTYILSNTGKVKNGRDIFRIKRIVPWDRIILGILGEERY